MILLDEGQLREKLSGLQEWQLEEGEIVKQFIFRDFAQAMLFVNRVAEAAEKAAHHPDIDIRWNKVRLGLSSHDDGGITDRDFSLASAIDALVRA